MSEERDDPCNEVPEETPSGAVSAEFQAIPGLGLNIGIVDAVAESQPGLAVSALEPQFDGTKIRVEGELDEINEQAEEAVELTIIGESPFDDDEDNEAEPVVGEGVSIEDVSDDVPELEEDISFFSESQAQGVLSKNFGEKYTWLFNNSSIVGETSNPDDLARYTSDGNSYFAFNVKKVYHKARTASDRNVLSCPVSIPSNPDVRDPMRWASEKNWINITHLGGPSSDGNTLDTRLRTEDINGRVFRNYLEVRRYVAQLADQVYFQNPYSPSILGNSVVDEVRNFYSENHREFLEPSDVWGIFYHDPRKSCYFINFRPAMQWNAVAREEFNQKNVIGARVRCENYALAAKVNNRENFWDWSKYLAGTINQDAETVLRVYRDIPENVSFKEALDNRNSILYWNTIYETLQFAHEEVSREMVDYRGLPPMNPNRVIRIPNRGEEREMYYDFSTKIPELLTKEESEILDVGNKAHFDIRPVYSYYDCLYEDVFSPFFEENQLPTPYLQTPQEHRGGRQNVVVPNDLDPEGFERKQTYMREKLKSAASYLENRENFDISIDQANFSVQYFDPQYDPIEVINFAKYMKAVGYYDFNFGKQPVTTYNLSSYSREELDNKYEERYMHPMFVEMEFDSIEKSQLAEAMTYEGDDVVLRSLFEALTNSEPDESIMDNYSYVQVESSGRYARTMYGEKSADTIPLDANLSIDLEDWWVSAYRDLMTDSRSAIARFANMIRLETIRARITRIMDSSMRSYKQLMSGEPAKSEVLGFVVQKFVKTGRRQDAHVSNFFILCNNERQVEKFVDTQVRYGEIYDYKIHRVVAVFGNKYAYYHNHKKRARERLIDIAKRPLERISLSGQGTSKSGRQNIERYDPAIYDCGNKENAFSTHPFGVANMSCVKIMLVPSERTQTCVVDRPPIFPNIEFIPYRNNKNNLAIAMTSNTGEFSAPPVILEEDDTTQFLLTGLSQGIPELINSNNFVEDAAQLFTSQNLKVLGEQVRMIKFRSDDPATKFEIFRLEKYPKNYTDFQHARITKVTNGTDGYLFKDDLMPDKKYYYIFRVEDIHGHVSNPTYVYEVELKTYDESVRLETKIVEMKDIEEIKKTLRQSTSDLRQFIHLRPNIRHRTVSLRRQDGEFKDFRSLPPEEMLGADTVADLGGTVVWGKRFVLTPKLLVEDNKKENLIC